MKAPLGSSRGSKNKCESIPWYFSLVRGYPCTFIDRSVRGRARDGEHYFTVVPRCCTCGINKSIGDNVITFPRSKRVWLLDWLLRRNGFPLILLKMPLLRASLLWVLIRYPGQNLAHQSCTDKQIINKIERSVREQLRERDEENLCKMLLKADVWYII